MGSHWDDATARWYADNYGDWPTITAVVELARVQDAAVVLDLGCGTGSALRHAATLNSDARLIGVDPMRVMLQRARGAGGPIEYRLGTAAEIPAEDASVSLVLAINTLHHWGDIEAGAAEVRRILAPGGRLVIADEDVTGEGRWPDLCAEISQIRAAGFDPIQSSRHETEGPDGVIRFVLLEAAVADWGESSPQSREAGTTRGAAS